MIDAEDADDLTRRALADKQDSFMNLTMIEVDKVIETAAKQGRRSCMTKDYSLELCQKISEELSKRNFRFRIISTTAAKCVKIEW